MKKRLKVCHISSAHSSEDVRIFHKECKSLSKAGFEVHLVVQGSSKEKEGVFFSGIGDKPEGRLKRMWASVKLALKAALKIQADVYHLHDPELLYISGRLKKTGAKVIFDAHEYLPEQILYKYWIPKWIRKPVSSFIKIYEETTLKNLDAVVCATPFIKERFQKVNPVCISLNNYPLSSEFLNGAPAKEEKENSPFFCYAGAITAPRGIKEVIEGIELVNDPDFKLQLMGRFSPQEFRNQLTLLPGWQKVVEQGVLEREEVREVYGQSIAGIVTFLPHKSHIHSQPNKLFEYMGAGLAIIASDFDLWRDLIEKNNCGICVDPENPKAIAEAINYLLNNKEEAVEMGEKGKMLIEEKYNWENESTKLVELYNSLN